ncbi:MAG: V-type ATP synthase subunit F [Candidatus Thermoplasmatota archaeon]|nr:V-type ATP synthase subunit F [Candidatus Thermoplasmatota archaeon]
MMCIIGSEDITYAFSSIGFEPVIADNNNRDRERVIKALETYDVILIEEEVAKEFEGKLKEVKEKGKVVIEVPGISGSAGYTRERIRRMVINAVGMDIFKENRER